MLNPVFFLHINLCILYEMIKFFSGNYVKANSQAFLIILKIVLRISLKFFKAQGQVKNKTQSHYNNTLYKPNVSLTGIKPRWKG